MSSFKVLSINVRGLRDSVKRRVVFDFIRSLHVSVCFLQEVHLKDKGDVGIFTREWTNGDSVWCVGGVHSTGVGILFGQREIVVEEVFVVVQGRVVGCDVAWGASKMRVFAIYGSHTSAGRQEMFGLLEPHLGTNRQVIVGGGF